MNVGPPSTRLLHELSHGLHFKQFPTYGYSEISQINREITWRFAELREIFKRQRQALDEFVSRYEDSNSEVENRPPPSLQESLAVAEYPHFALWVHICAIQQLKRALNIYKHERVKWISHLCLQNFLVTGGNTGVLRNPAGSLNDDLHVFGTITGRLSATEVRFMEQLSALVNRYGSAMTAVMTGQHQTTFSQSAKDAVGRSRVTLPDQIFCHRMARLARVDPYPGNLPWEFHNPALPQLSSDQEEPDTHYSQNNPRGSTSMHASDNEEESATADDRRTFTRSRGDAA